MGLYSIVLFLLMQHLYVCLAIRLYYYYGQNTSFHDDNLPNECPSPPNESHGHSTLPSFIINDLSIINEVQQCVREKLHFY